MLLLKQLLVCFIILLIIIIAVTLAHLFPKAYSLLALIEPSSTTPTLKSIQASMCIDEIIQVIHGVLPYFSYSMILYNIIQRKEPGLDSILSHLYFPTEDDDKCCKHSFYLFII